MSKKRKQSPPLISYERKMEMLGIVIIALAVALIISIVTYRSEDMAVIRSVSFRTLLDFSQGPALRIQNGLGPAGAYLSHFFVHMLFGYFSLLLVTLFLGYGWKIFRRKELNPFHLKGLYAVFVTILLASVMGWIHNEFQAVSENWAGASGISVALFLRGLTGKFGPAIILSSLCLIALFLMINRDIQEGLDRLSRLKSRLANLFMFRKGKKNIPAYDDSDLTNSSDDHTNRDDSDDLVSGEEERRKRWEKIVIASRRREEERRMQEDMEEMQESGKPRVRLEKEPSGDLAKNPVKDLDEPGDGKENAPDLKEAGESGQDLDITVYRGRPEEQAGKKKLSKEKETSTSYPRVAYAFPTLDLLDKPRNDGNSVDYEEINRNKMIILDKLNRHGIDILAIEAIVGPTVTLYELQPAPDVKISRIESYANDLKMAMAARGLRIIAPIPGKSAVGIEVPNRNREMVHIRSLINTKKFAETKMALPVAFGRTIENEVFMVDLARLPHVLMAGATGSGKTVGINTIITCLLYKCHPRDLKFVMIDPKKIELSLFRNIQRHFLATLPNATEPIITDTAEVLQTLNSVCKEMDNRYELLKMGQVRDISSYNEKFNAGSLEDDLGHHYLPYIVIIIDELADLMLTAGKQIEEPIARLAQLARAVGIHLVVATQRPSVNVITGTIKANFPARIAYQVASKIDSRTILDTMGADQLVGRGDMLYNGGGANMIRLQNAFVSTEEVEKINTFIGRQENSSGPYYLPEVEDTSERSGTLSKSDRDELFEEAARLMVLHQQGSVSLLQRKLKLGYNRAGRLIDQLFAAGIVGPYQGSTAREVLVENDEELDQLLRELDE